MHPADQTYLKELWRASKHEPVQEYKLTTVTYGTTAAPFLAIRTLLQLAQDEKEKYPQASHIVSADFYVDDLLTGADSLREAKTIQRELISLLASGGFKLRKWTTNQQTLLQNIPEDLREKNQFEISDGDPIRALGLYWMPGSDSFQFRVNISNENSTSTKRTVLSDIAKLFDPAGWLSPVIIRAKLLMQELWIAKLDWDSPLPADLADKWHQFKKELLIVQSIKIPRWIKYTKATQSIEIHGFCDASEKAYAAVVYSKILTTQGDSVVTMITSKTKVAPIKNRTSLPRLELCAAVLLTKLVARIKEALEFKDVDTYAWTDSKITLAWIQGVTKKWESFISSRVTEIRTTIKPSAWHYVKSEQNPADCASRGISPVQLKTHPLWWSGPHWLTLSKESWPIDSDSSDDRSNILTTECSNACHATTTTLPNDIFMRFSNLKKMLRSLTHCRRFINACFHRPEHRTGEIQADELHQTLLHMVKILQKESYPSEIKEISKGKPISRSSKLLSLTPFLDENGLLRLGGRLANAQLPFNQKHPLILPHGHHITKLIIQDAHEKTLHGGIQATLAYLRQKYWIIDAKSAVKSVIHRCVICCRYRGISTKQLMGNLPAVRVVPSKPFTNTGIDYAGPFYLRVSKGRGTKSFKGYIAVFVCLATKALHLEAVSDLTTEAFLASYKRFTARRGQCANIYSDNGTTFVGAKNELDKQFVKAVQQSQEEASHQLANYGTKWHFIPPSSPHFGGLWEAGVKSTKYHLKRIAGDVNWTFEEFSTLLAQIEACLNSRPLCPLSNDPHDLTVLTPGHFLIGRPLVAPPEPAEPEKAIHCLTRWKLINKLQHDFWKIWCSEYLSRLQQRTKWHTKTENIKAGDIVLLKEDNLPPGRWALGRIEDTHPGSDGLVRVATIKTKKNTIKRPISKICKLPFNAEDLPVSDQPIHPNDQQSSYTTATTTTMQRPKRKSTETRKIFPTNIPVRPPIEELQRTSLPRNKRVKISSLLFLLNCVLGALAQSTTFKENLSRTALPVEIKPFEHNPGMYLEHISHLHMVNNIWNIVVYYDLNTYYQQLNGFEECLEKLADLCNKTITYKYYCNSILAELQHKVNEMHHNNLILHKRNGNHLMKERQRRAPLEIIGTLQNYLFGVLDQNYANYVEGEIEKLRENENYLLSLAKNQTSIAEVTSNVLKKTTEEIQHQFEVFNNHINSNLDILRLGAQKTEIIQTFTALTAYTSFIMNNYERVQKELIELVLDAHNGKISPFLLTPHQLRAQIKHIREHISTSLIIPGEANSEDLLNLYKIITVKSRVMDSRIIFKMQIPLPDAKVFQLFKLHPIPTEHNNEYFYIEPTSEFLATSLHRDLYYPLTQPDLAECTKTEILGYLCE